MRSFRTGSPVPESQSAQKTHVAGGISLFLDEVPNKCLQPHRIQLIAYFGRGKYYRFYRKECHLLPEDQNYIRRVFHQYNVSGYPVFDSYSDEYK